MCVQQHRRYCRCEQSNTIIAKHGFITVSFVTRDAHGWSHADGRKGAPRPHFFYGGEGFSLRALWVILRKKGGYPVCVGQGSQTVIQTLLVVLRSLYLVVFQVAVSFAKIHRLSVSLEFSHSWCRHAQHTCMRGFQYNPSSPPLL